MRININFGSVWNVGIIIYQTLNLMRLLEVLLLVWFAPDVKTITIMFVVFAIRYSDEGIVSTLMEILKMTFAFYVQTPIIKHVGIVVIISRQTI
jgi:uncharacterized membrane protein